MDQLARERLKFRGVLLLWVIGFLFFAIEAYFLILPNTYNRLQNMLPDEALFFDCVEPYVKYLRSFDSTFIPNGMPAGYGITFWFLFAFLKIVIGSYTGIRWFFLGLKYLSVILIVRCFGWKYWRSGFIFFLFFFATPGFWFFGKVIAPEYLIMFLLACSISFVFQDEMKIGSNYVYGLLFATLAAYTKVSHIIIPVVITIYGIIFSLRKKEGFKNLLTACLISGGTVLVFTSVTGGIKETISSLVYANSIMADFKFSASRFIDNFNMYSVSWDQIEMLGTKEGFLAIFTGLFAGMASLIFRIIKRVPVDFPYNLGQLFIIISLSFLAILSAKDIAHSWYVMCCFFIGLVGVSLSIPEILKSNRIMGRICIVVFAMGAKGAYNRIDFKQRNINTIENYEIKNAHITEIIKRLCPQIKTAAVDILVDLTAADFSYIPLRKSLLQVIVNDPMDPDVLVLNERLGIERSPLLNLVIKSKVTLYEERKDFLPDPLKNEIIMFNIARCGRAINESQ